MIIKAFLRKQIAMGAFDACRISSVNQSSKFISTVSSKKVSGITLIFLNRPNTINAIDTTTLRALKENIHNFENDKESNYAVLYGQGGNFSSGFDLYELSQVSPLEMCEEFKEFLERPAKKPIIAAVSGYAVGQGFDLALWCDLRFVEEDSLMGFYNRRFAIPTSNVTIRRLSKMIGISRTMNMVLHGRHITSREAQDYGISNKTVSSGTAIGEAVNKAIQLSRLSQESILADRATLLLQTDSNVPDKDWVLEQTLNTKIAFEKSKPLIEQFVRKEFGRHGTFKNANNRESLNFFVE